MERYKIIENTNSKYPIYYVIDTFTGQEITQRLSREAANTIVKNVKEAEAWDNI